MISQGRWRTPIYIRCPNKRAFVVIAYAIVSEIITAATCSIIVYTLHMFSQDQLQAFMNQYFENSKTVRMAIEFTQRFER